MRIADFIHSIHDYAGRSVLVISDLKLGRIPLADDLINVLDMIAKREDILPYHYMIVFTDENDLWNGYDAVLEEFIPLEQPTWKEAVTVYIQQQLLLNQY